MASDHAVIIHFQYGSTELSRLYSLEDELIAAIDSAAAGEFDGNEIATDGSAGVLYIYGPDADKLFEVIKPVLEASAFMRGAVATKRYGLAKSSAKESRVAIGS